jgi:hypothetical protein
MKSSNRRNVNIFILIFLLLSILISSLALAATNAYKVKIKADFDPKGLASFTLKEKINHKKATIGNVL